MTLDEAIKHCEDVARKNQAIADSFDFYSDAWDCEECAADHRQLAVWLKELKAYKGAEPCEDAISRQAVLDLVADYDLSMGQVVKGIHSLPSVTPAEKVGHWIAQDIHNCHTDFRCSKCCYIHSFMHLYGKPTADYTYCPMCGAKMEEVKE